MPIIRLTTEIKAPIEICFDLARSIDLHMAGTQTTGEKAVGGVTTGLIGPDQEVTWHAKHFGLWQHLTSKITAFDRPFYFRDTMQRGAFKRFDHHHYFQNRNNVTIMTDEFDYESPLGFLGKLADLLFLKRYMECLLHKKNEVLKSLAERCPEQYLRSDTRSMLRAMRSYRHILLYDGVCALCDRLNVFVISRDSEGIFAFASLQGSFAKGLLEKYHRNTCDLDTFYCMADYGTAVQRLLSKSAAALFVLNELGGSWRVTRILRIIPAPVLDALYDWVARNRYRMFGRYEMCLPRKVEWEERFIDVSEE